MHPFFFDVCWLNSSTSFWLHETEHAALLKRHHNWPVVQNRFIVFVLSLRRPWTCFLANMTSKTERKSYASSVTTWPNGQGVWLRIRRLRVRVPSWLKAAAPAWLPVTCRQCKLQSDFENSCLALEPSQNRGFVCSSRPNIMENLGIDSTHSHIQSQPSTIWGNFLPQKLMASVVPPD